MKRIRFPYQKISVKHLEDNISSNGKLTALINVCGFFLCKKGWAKIALGKNTYVIHPGDIHFYSPSMLVSLLEKSDDLEGIVVKSSLDLVLPVIENTIDTHSLIMMIEKPCISLSNVQQQYIEEMAELIEKREQRYQSLPDKSPALPILYKQLINMAEAYINELLYAYFSNQQIRPITQTGRDKIFQNFMISLLKNYKREREVAFYAQEQYLTPRYFSTVVKQVSGHSASQWIIEMVISNAGQMLLNSDKSIKEIAHEFHFPTQSFFGKYFKQYTGFSPKDYRERHNS